VSATAGAPLERRLLPDTAGVGADGALTIGGCDVRALADEFGTPLFVYDEAHLRARCREAATAFGPDGVVYATKAFLCRAMARLAHEEGLLLDVASGGELHTVLSAGVPASRCTLHGNNKSVTELAAAMTAGVRHINIDCVEEIDRIEALVADGLPAPRVALRITPGVHAHTHSYVQTGQDDSKFGFTLSNGTAERAIARVRASVAMELVGLHSHIGSQVFSAENFARASQVMVDFARSQGVAELTLGGGLGVAYLAEEEAPTISQWARVLREATEGCGMHVMVEPGRSVVAAAAVTVYEVGVVKRIPGVRTYVAVDGGMSDNPRPVLYGSGYEGFVVRAPFAPRPQAARVVGKHCESGDVLIFEAHLPGDLAVGDLLATPVTGAYGLAMASNYNKLPRPPVVFVRDGAARLVVRRETFDDLLATDLG
jgi:diaminopimelate decarboxylase